MRGVGSYRDVVVRLEAELFGDGLHLLSRLSSRNAPQDTAPVHREVARLTEVDGNWREALKNRLSAGEAACVSHRASALTRMEARASLASILEVDEGRTDRGRAFFAARGHAILTVHRAEVTVAGRPGVSKDRGEAVGKALTHLIDRIVQTLTW